MLWLDRIEISNFKTIGELDRTFAEPSAGDDHEGQPWLMVLGENSVGKSSLLQAVALALMPDEERARHGPARAWFSRRALNTLISALDASRTPGRPLCDC